MSWTVHDVNTGDVVGSTEQAGAGRMFLHQLQQHQRRKEEVYVVFGPCRHRAVRVLVEDVRKMGVPTVFDRQAAESLLILAGKPSEWEDFTK